MTALEENIWFCCPQEGNFKLLTDCAPIKLDPHGNPATPRDWMYLEEATVHRTSEPMRYHYIAVIVALENLRERNNQNDQMCFSHFSWPLKHLFEKFNLGLKIRVEIPIRCSDILTLNHVTTSVVIWSLRQNYMFPENYMKISPLLEEWRRHTQREQPEEI